MKLGFLIKNLHNKEVSKKVYKFGDSYVSIDKLYFPKKPFLVLEFADKIEGLYEDADTFLYGLSMEEVKLEIQNMRWGC